MKNDPARLRVTARLLPATLIILLATIALAVPFHQPTIDGTITGDGVDWDPADLVVDDSHDDNFGISANLRELWCTWDADNLYVGIIFQDYGTAEAMSVFLDLGRGIGPNDARDLDTFAGNFRMPDDHRFELVLGRIATDGASGDPPISRLATDDDGTTTALTAQVNASMGTSIIFPPPAASEGDKARLINWLNAEIALPWTAIYPDLGGGVPANAVIKAVAVVTSAADSLNGIDSAPDNDGLDRGTTQVLLENLHASVIDGNGDGVPDAADATISGTTTLPADPGTGGVTVTAEMIDPQGREPGAPLSVITTAEGVRTWTLPRLSAGTYLVTVEALGYFAFTDIVVVGQSQQVTGIDQELKKATVISGAITFDKVEAGEQIVGRTVLKDAAGLELNAVDFDFPPTGGSYTFFVEDNGDYTVGVSAETYFTQDQTVSVTAGTDRTDVDFTLIRHTEISGAIEYETGTGEPGTIYMVDAQGDTLDSSDFAPLQEDFRFFTPEGGDITLIAGGTKTYVTTDTTVTVVLHTDLKNIPLLLLRQAFISGSLAFEGPDSPGLITVYNELNGAVEDTASFATTGDPFGFYVEPGSYRMVFDAVGYQFRVELVQAGFDDIPLGVIDLTAVRATHLETVDINGEEIAFTSATVFRDTWTSTEVRLAARDNDGKDDLYDLDGRLTNFHLTARKINDRTPPRGTTVFYDAAEDSNARNDVLSFNQGRASFWISSTEVEVLRIYLAQPNKEPIAGLIEVQVVEPNPTSVLLTADLDTLVADNQELVEITAQLYDSALKESKVVNVPVSFSVANTSTGAAQFDVPTVLTNTEGEAIGRFRATGAGQVHITASAVIGNRTLEVVAYALGSGETYLDITSLPGVTTGWRLNLPGNQADLNSPVTVTAQTIDFFGNATPDFGQDITFVADPPELGSFAPATASSDLFGRASSVFTPSGTSGLVVITGLGTGLNGDQAGLQLRDIHVIPDPLWYEESPGPQTFDKTDLTALIVDNTPDELLLEIPFASDWKGLQLHVAFEINSDAAGAILDPFEMPVNYGHDLKPDYVLTSKYSVNDYGDFRRWNGTGWDFWNPTTGSYGGDGNIQPTWVDKGANAVKIRIPKEVFGTSLPPSLMLEVYLTQEEDGDKRSAFDSAPQDSTLSLTFDYTDPDPGDWESTKLPVTLLNWGPTYTVKTDFPETPSVENVTADPDDLDAGETIILTALVTDGGDGIGDVLADLSAMGGNDLARMYDDGDPAHGDVVAGDGVYAMMTIVPITNPGGTQELVVRAYDGGNVWAEAAGVEIKVTALITPIIVALDPVGDDHGPNRPGTSKFFYTYPTNIAFVAGGFDLTGLTVFETVANVGGELVDMIAFQVNLGDFPDPDDPGTANWSPLYADLNITKIDILIDNAPGGATNTLPWRQAAFQPWDAWDWAIIMDGWYKALIPSLSQNTVDSWRDNALRGDKNILLFSDPDLDTVTALVSKSDMGDPTPEDIAKWDICVAICSHDFGGEEVLGGIRWVDEGRTEWRFGGGDNDNRDSNYMDLLMVPGSGHKPGRPQEEIMDYNTVDAIDRWKAGQTSVLLEMSQFEDTGPPVIDTGGGKSGLTLVEPLQDAPLAMTLSITDDNLVDRATFRYRSTEFTGEGWDREVPMGFLGRDRWIVDILPSWLESNLKYSPVDSFRYLEFEVEASDPLDKTSFSPVTTLRIDKNAYCRPEDGTLDTADLALLQVDGSAMILNDRARTILVNQHIAEAWTGEPVDADTMGAYVQLEWDVCNITQIVQKAPVIPEGRPLGVFRQTFLATSDTSGGYIDYPDKLPVTVQLSLHYPQDWVPEGVDENLIAIYEYNEQSDRWIFIGGNVTPTGNNVTATVTRSATYGLFITEAAGFHPEDVISGVTLSPNPFSPNGDDLYDETNISFFLSQEATVTVEIYNIDGDRKIVLAQTFPFSGSDITDPTPRRVPGLVWDGRDFSGELVPYGIYIVRVLATFNEGGGTRTIRSTHTLAVIR